MNNLYRFLRSAAFMVLMMTLPAQAQNPFILTTENDVSNGTQHYYLIQSIDRPTFYAIPHTDAEGSKVSTTSIPNANMRWYFMDAGSDSDHQYYYIVNSTGRCLYRYDNNHDGIQIKNTYAELSSLSDGELNKYKFYLTQTGSDYFIHPKGASNLYLNKRNTNVPYSNGTYIKASTYYDSPSVWNFVAVGNVTWPQPFTVSTNADKHYYKFQNVTDASFYLSTAEGWTTVSNTGSNENVWYFLDAGTDATYSNCHYYYIVNASTEKYLYYTGGTNDDVAKVMDYNSGEEDRYCFLIVDAAYKPDNINYATSYTIVPKLRQAYFSDKDSFAPMAMNDGSHLLLKNDRSSGNYNSHWEIEETIYSLVEAPTITNNYDGTISLSTTTPDATIYYTINGDTPDNTSTEYSLPFSLGDATVIKAIACKGSDESVVTTYNVPKYTTPIISFDNSTLEVTITCTGATDIYYTTDGSTPTTSSTAYSNTFTVSSGTTVKAISTRLGYLNSDVATKYIQGNNYSQNYLTFDVLTDGTICWKAFGSEAKTISYRINGGLWTSITSTSDGITFGVNEGDIVEFKGSNETYATSKSAYSGFDGGTATYDISGNIMSLIYGDEFVGQTTMSGTYNFCSLFKQSKAVSAEHLILPAASLTACCYRAMFSKCHTLEVAPALPATTLAASCYWYMFEECAITTAPELNATTLVQECYGHMFENAGSLNHIQCLATSGFNASNCLEGWTTKVASSGFFVNAGNANWSTGASGIPSGWKIYNDFFLYNPEISCDGEHITMTCATQGADIYYRLNQTGDFLPYSSPIAISETTFVEAYSSKESNTSNIVSDTFVIYDNPFDESTRSLDTWTYGNTQVTLPYSVNGENGHSSSYSRGTYTFETTITLYHLQPTYLWFQHADQSADVYVDDVFVTTHWGGYNAFFVDISNNVHVGTNRIKVVLNNTKRNTLAPYTGDFNFNATLGKVKLLTSPVLPSMDYGYDGFHITATNVSSSSATLTIKTNVPLGATLICKIDDEDSNYHYSSTQSSTGTDQTFTTTIANPTLWNGTINPHLYTVTLEIYKDGELYHRFQRGYGIRYYDYVYNETGYLPNNEAYTGFLLNGSPYKLRGVCMHNDLEGKANALTDTDIDNDFNIIQELGCNFIRLAHYPHPKEVFDWCDRLGIIVQTEAPCVNDFQSTLPQEYYDHLYIQYEDMVRQHFNHPCIMFWGLGNEIKTDYAPTARTKLEAYRTFIKGIDSERWVGYVVDHNKSNPSNSFGNPEMDWFGCNIYVGWYIDQDTNDPTSQLNTRKANIITNLSKPLAFSEYGCGGTQHCHSENPQSTTTKGNLERHDIEYQMWLHEGHIAAIKNFPELLFTSQWQLFDIAVSNRQEGYTICLDGENISIDDNLRYLNNKGLVERDHKTKKDPFYLYKAWWNQTDKFVHICGKDYEKLTDRVIKCYTNDGDALRLFVNNVEIETVTVENNIATFTARNFNSSDVIRVDGATTYDAFTFTNDFVTDGNWGVATNWNGHAVPAAGSDVIIRAECTIPNGVVVQANHITIGENGSLTIADGGQLYHNNEGVTATVQKSITAYTVQQNQGNTKTDGWHLIGSPSTENIVPSEDNGFLTNNYDLYFYDESTHYWRNHRLNGQYANFNIEPLNGYLYANSQNVTLVFQGNLRAGNATVNAPLSYTSNVSNVTGFNLVGNPFAHNVTGFTGSNISSEVYRMNDYKTDLVVSEVSGDTPLLPGEGFFVKATGDNASITFNNNAKGENVKHNHIALEISENGKLIDRFILKQDGESLEKFTLNENGTKIFATRNQQDWAVVTKEGNEQAINFKAAKNGTYTITVNPENVEMDYLHLIDNMTGADINLLSERDCGSKPAMTAEGRGYTFEAKTTDYESRFKLLFAAKNEDGPSTSSGTFAFISNGNIIITTDVEDATLQVIDVMGRVIVSVGGRTASVPTAGMTAGIYMLRLINGNDVKTQKIVIK